MQCITTGCFCRPCLSVFLHCTCWHGSVTMSVGIALNRHAAKNIKPFAHWVYLMKWTWRYGIVTWGLYEIGMFMMIQRPLWTLQLASSFPTCGASSLRILHALSLDTPRNDRSRLVSKPIVLTFCQDHSWCQLCTAKCLVSVAGTALASYQLDFTPVPGPLINTESRQSQHVVFRTQHKIHRIKRFKKRPSWTRLAEWAHQTSPPARNAFSLVTIPQVHQIIYLKIREITIKCNGTGPVVI